MGENFCGEYDRYWVLEKKSCPRQSRKIKKTCSSFKSKRFDLYVQRTMRWKKKKNGPVKNKIFYLTAVKSPL